MRTNISPDVYILSQRDLAEREDAAFRRGVERGKFEAAIAAGKAPVALNCQNWCAGHCQICGAQHQDFQVSGDFKCPNFAPRHNL